MNDYSKQFLSNPSKAKFLLRIVRHCLLLFDNTEMETSFWAIIERVDEVIKLSYMTQPQHYHYLGRSSPCHWCYEHIFIWSARNTLESVHCFHSELDREWDRHNTDIVNDLKSQSWRDCRSSELLQLKTGNLVETAKDLWDMVGRPILERESIPGGRMGEEYLDVVWLIQKHTDTS